MSNIGVGTVISIRTRDGKTCSGGVKSLEKGLSITLQLHQQGPPALKTIAWNDITSSAVVEPGKIPINILRDQVLSCYNQIFQSEFTIELARPAIAKVTSVEQRKDLERKILLKQAEIKIQQEMHQGLQPHLAALNEKDRQMMTLAVHQQQTANAKRGADVKRQQQQQQQKQTPTVKKTPVSRTASISAGASSPHEHAQGLSSPAASAAKQHHQKNKPPLSKAGRVGQLIKALPADKQAGAKVMTKRKLQELAAQIAPQEKLDEEVEDILLDIADDFIESVTDFACLLARHRNSKVLEVKDVQLHLERNWNMWLPGFGPDRTHAPKKTKK